MVKRKSRKATTKRRAARRVYAAPRKRHVKSGTQYIPGAAATVALVAANATAIQKLGTYLGNGGLSEAPQRITNIVLGSTDGGVKVRNRFINSDALVRDAVAIAGGYIAGECVKKYAPSVIKNPIGKIAKKIPRVI